MSRAVSEMTVDRRTESLVRRRKVAALRNDGLTFHVIGETMGVSRQRAHQMTKQPTRPDPAEALKMLEQFRPVFMLAEADDVKIADAILELTSAGITQSAIAEAYGKRTSWVSFYQKLNKMPDTLVVYLVMKKVKATTLVKSVDLLGIPKTQQRIKQIADEHRRIGYNGRITAREIAEWIPPP